MTRLRVVMSSDIPTEAMTAVTRALMTYEPEATRTIIDSPGALLGVMLETSRRAVAAASPFIRAEERERIRHPEIPCCRAVNLEWYGCACDDDCDCTCALCACQTAPA